MNKLKLEYRKASELAKNVKNWKIHPANQRQAFSDLFDKVGWAGALLLNEETDTLVDGHMRRDEFFDSDELVPVLVGRWTEEQEEAILLSLDPIAGMIEADKGALLALTETVATDSVALDQLVSDIAEEHGLLDELEANEPIEIVEDAPQIDKAEELQAVWQVQEGDLWQLGRHRLICGDCTDRATVDRLMDGKRADLMVTDPPYGVKMDKGFEGFEGFGGFGKPIARRQYSDDWDNERPSKETFELLLTVSVKNIIFGGNFFADILPQSKHWVVWDKLNTMPTFGDCELVWTDIDRKSVKKITVQYNGLLGREKERFHPTQKPVKIISSIIDNYSETNQLIYDPFLGSGTTLIAAHQTNRICYGSEISTKYCAVILQRYADLTGETPIKS